MVVSMLKEISCRNYNIPVHRSSRASSPLSSRREEALPTMHDFLVTKLAPPKRARPIKNLLLYPDLSYTCTLMFHWFMHDSTCIALYKKLRLLLSEPHSANGEEDLTGENDQNEKWP